MIEPFMPKIHNYKYYSVLTILYQMDLTNSLTNTALYFTHHVVTSIVSIFFYLTYSSIEANVSQISSIYFKTDR